ncbi:Dabb family protein [Microbacterium sp. KR10-403]|uniref:Dabb family protein n=1 Tax=Microbacterium sp. KR10-403 TaxID=3158581 RepID=UPI0032E4D7CD
MTLRHVVSWKMAATDAATRADHAREIAERLNALVGVVPTIGTLTAGPNVVDGNWDVALVADFADKAALDAYAVHPAHQEVVAYVRSVVADRVAVDFEL